MNEVKIPLKLTGIAAIKAELKSLRDQMAEATNPEAMAELADKAGALQQKLAAINGQIANFNSGSNLDQAKGAFEELKGSIEELNFSSAAKKAATFNQTIKAIKPEDLTKQFKGFAGTVKGLGQTFVSLGQKILANPIFLLVAVIVGIVYAIGKFLQKIGVLQKILDFLMIPINKLIEGFNYLTDAMGLTHHAADEYAKKLQKANEKAAESSKKKTEKIVDSFDIEIAKAKAAGKSTTDLEKAKSKAISDESARRLKAQKKEYDLLQKYASADNLERRKKLREQIEAEKKIIKDGQKERQLLEIQDAADKKQKQKEKNEQAKADAKTAADNAKAYAKNRLDAERTIIDLQISLIEDDAKRELATTEEKYRRLIEDVKNNENLIGSEKKRLTALYESQRIAELEKNAKAEAELQKKRQQEIAQAIKDYKNQELDKEEAIQEQIYQLGLTAQQRELEANKYYYDELIAQAKRYGQDATLFLEEQKKKEAEINKKYTKDAKDKALAEIEAARQVRDAKIQAVGDYANSLINLTTLVTKDQKKLEKINKASALVQIGIDTAKAISSLMAASQSNPYNSLTGGLAGIAQFASGILQITTNVAKAKSLLSNPSGNVSGGGSSSPSSSSTSVTPLTPAVQMFGQGNNLNTTGQPQSVATNQNIVVQAVVSESDITNTQSKINKIKKGSEL